MATPIQKSRSVPAGDKATFHQFEGKVLRKFFGLSPDDAQAIEQELDVRLSVNLARSEGSRSA